MSTVRIQVRRGTASQWTSVNPILAAGEMGVESDTNLFKFGNGSSTWTALAYANNSDVAISEISQDAVNNALTMGSGLTKTYNDGANTITIAVDNSYFTELAQDAINSAFVEGNGITRVYNDTGNTFTVAVDTSVIANKTYVTDAVAGLANTVDSDYISASDRGIAGGVASLNNSGLIPDTQINNATWATKFDVASLSSGLQIKSSVRAASTANWSAVRSAGTSDASGGNGVGEYLTASANGAITIDGVTLAANDRVLLKDQTDAKQNGIYVVTNAGSGSTKAILTRAQDADNSVDGEVREGMFAFSQEGTSNSRDGYVLLASASRPGEIFQLGTDSLNFTQFTGAIPVNIGTGLTKSSDQISVDFTVAAEKSALDSLISSTATNFTNQTTATTNLTTRVAAAETNITAVQAYGARITTAESDITAIKAVNATQTTAITDLTSVNGTQSAAISAIETKNSDQDATLASHTSSLSTQSSAITAIQTVNATQTSDISAINSSITTINTNLAPKASPTFTGTVVLPSTTSIGNVSATEIGYVDGVTSAIQTQLDAKLGTSSAASTYETISNVALKAPLANPTFTGTVNGITKAMVGLGSVDNTADADKPVSTAATTALALKAPLASPALTGVPTAPTAAAATNTTQIATTAYVRGEVAALVNSAGATLDTLGEIATALGNDANLSTTLTNAIALKAPLASPTFSGTVTVGASGVAFTDATQTKAGVPSITTISQKTASYTLAALTERDAMIEMNSASATTLTVPTNATVAYPVGTSIDVLRVGAGAVDVAAAAGVTINATPGLKLRAQWSSATLIKRSTDTWVLVGDLSA